MAKNFQYSNNSVQSSNALFHFMKEERFLFDIIKRKLVFPRYCEEDIKYLGIENDGKIIEKITVLQKCFCDIPLHQIYRRFPFKLGSESKVSPEDVNNTHPGFYGEYAIAFSKLWGVENEIQPVHYINCNSDYALQFGKVLNFAIEQENLDDRYYDEIINRLCYMKPLKGWIKRYDENGVPYDISKNFQDECEWRYIPSDENLKLCNLGKMIVSEDVINGVSGRDLNSTNDIISKLKEYEPIALKFDYKDVRYIIVPNTSARNNLIKLIASLNGGNEDEVDYRMILISKIIVLNEISEDW